MSSDLPEYIVRAICRPWPDGIVRMPVSEDGAPFRDLLPKLRARLAHIPGSAVFYEREPQGGPR